MRCCCAGPRGGGEHVRFVALLGLSPVPGQPPQVGKINQLANRQAALEFETNIVHKPHTHLQVQVIQLECSQAALAGSLNSNVVTVPAGHKCNTGTLWNKQCTTSHSRLICLCAAKANRDSPAARSALRQCSVAQRHTAPAAHKCNNTGTLEYKQCMCVHVSIPPRMQQSNRSWHL